MYKVTDVSLSYNLYAVFREQGRQMFANLQAGASLPFKSSIVNRWKVLANRWQGQYDVALITLSDCTKSIVHIILFMLLFDDKKHE